MTSNNPFSSESAEILKALFVLSSVFIALAFLAKGIYPPFRGQGSLYLDLLGLTPDFVRFMAGTTLTLLSANLYAAIRNNSSSEGKRPRRSLAPTIACAVALLSFFAACRLDILDPSNFRLAYTSSALWFVTFAFALRQAIFYVPARKSWRYLSMSVLVGIFAALSPRIEPLTSSLLSPLLLLPTLTLVVGLLAAFGQSEVFVYQREDEVPYVTANNFRVNIAESCSGYEGAGLALLLVAVFVFFNRRRLRFPQTLVIFPIIASTMFFMNAIRLAILVLIGAHISPAVAVEGFHIYAGWIYLIILVLGSVVWLETSHWFCLQPQVSINWRYRNLAVPNDRILLLIPLLSFLAMSIALGALSSNINWLYPLTVFTGGFITFKYRKVLNDIAPSFVGLAVAAGCGVAILWLVMVPHDMAESGKVTAELFSAPTWAILAWLIFRLLGAIILVPVIEELAFRGAIQPQIAASLDHILGSRGAILCSIAVTSILFGFMHSAVIAGMVAGAVYGWLRQISNSLFIAVLSHSTSNFIISMFVLTTGKWSYW